MQYKVSEVSGALLDAAVSKAEGIQHDTSALLRAVFMHQGSDSRLYAPSTDWRDGGPIIERERIECMTVPSVGGVAPPKERTWSAWGKMRNGVVSGHWVSKSIVCEGPTILIAAMRAFVASKFGETVEVPDAKT